MPFTVGPSQTKSQQRRQRRLEGSVTPLRAPLDFSRVRESPPSHPRQTKRVGELQNTSLIVQRKQRSAQMETPPPKFLSSPFSGWWLGPSLPWC